MSDPGISLREICQPEIPQLLSKLSASVQIKQDGAEGEGGTLTIR